MANGLLETMSWRDVKGNVSHNRFFVSSGGTTITQRAAALAVITAEAVLSTAAPENARGPYTSQAGPAQFPGSVVDFATVEDKARFTFQTAAGSFHHIEVPAPKTTIFLADTETVNSTDTDVVAFTSAVIANATNAFGDPIAFFAGAIRTRRKLQRRMTIWTKSGNLDEPAE